MSYQDFARLLIAASEFASVEDYVAEAGGSVPESVPDERLPSVMGMIWAYAHDRSFACVRGLSGLSRAAFAREYRVPLRTLESWEAGGDGARTAPGYVVDLIAYAVVMGGE